MSAARGRRSCRYAPTSRSGRGRSAIVRFASNLAIPGWATTVVGDLMIILLQTIVMVVAASLMMLAGRSSRPIIPIADAGQFVAERECYGPEAILMEAAPARAKP